MLASGTQPPASVTNFCQWVEIEKFCAAEVMFGLVELSWVGRWEGMGRGKCLVYISSSLVSARLHTAT